MNFKRIKQVIKYGWLHAGQISDRHFDGGGRRKRLLLFADILKCFHRYGMWSNQYVKEAFWELEPSKRDEIGLRYLEANIKREKWVKDFYDNRAFLAKWKSYEIEASARKREARNVAYTKRYCMGDGCMIEHGVEFSRQHHLPGTIKIGSHVLFAKNVFVDYSGEIVIEDDVKITAGVSIESHHRDLEAYMQGRDVNIPTKLFIGQGAYIGTHAIILDSCNYIGKYARIGAGAVVTKDIPDYSVAVGVPAKVIKEIEH